MRRLLGAVLIFRDITFRKSMELELERSERLEAVGLLAGGIAHDFNNIMTAILCNLAIAKSCSDDQDRTVKKAGGNRGCSTKGQRTDNTAIDSSQRAEPQ